MPRNPYEPPREESREAEPGKLRKFPKPQTAQFSIVEFAVVAGLIVALLVVLRLLFDWPTFPLK